MVGTLLQEQDDEWSRPRSSVLRRHADPGFSRTGGHAGRALRFDLHPHLRLDQRADRPRRGRGSVFPAAQDDLCYGVAVIILAAITTIAVARKSSAAVGH